MSICPKCGYWIKRAIYGISDSRIQNGRFHYLFQCPNSHTWHVFADIGKIAISGTVYDLEALRAYNKEKAKLWNNLVRSELCILSVSNVEEK